jgi:hypothetical protein
MAVCRAKISDEKLGITEKSFIFAPAIADNTIA